MKLKISNRENKIQELFFLKGNKIDLLLAMITKEKGE